MTLDRFIGHLTRDCRVAPASHVLAAVSGGADSVALLCLLKEAAGALSLRVSCAHVEHGIRGEASREDERFVRALCERMAIPFVCARVDAPAYQKAHGCGLEEAARTLRYEALERMADELGADCIALAHHAQDQAETVLLRASRGCDVRGLSAMRARRGRFVRPLLEATPRELRDYLSAIGQDWREDETNADVRYARNRVRLRAMPELERACPGAGAALARLARAAQRDEDYFDAQLAALTLPAPVPLVNGLAFSREALGALHPALSGRLLVRLIEQSGLAPQGSAAIDAVVDALSREGEAAVNLTRGAHAVLGARYVCLTRDEPPPLDVPLAREGETVTAFGRFFVRPARPGETGDGKRVQAMPARLFDGATVGSRRPGERIRAFGAAGHTPIKKLLMDAGVERAMRDSVPIVRSGGEALWIAGVRAGAACAVARGEEALCVEYLGSVVAE